MLPLKFRGINTIWFDRHLYQLLIHLDETVVDVTPIHSTKGRPESSRI